MKDNGHNEHMTSLATKYLSGNASPKEIRELEAWVLADPENKQQFKHLKKAWMLSGTLKNDVKVDVDDLWQQTAKVLSGNGKKEPAKVVPFNKIIMRYAAGFALLAVAAFLIYQFLGRDAEMSVTTTDEIRTFVLPDGSHVTLNRHSSLRHFKDEASSERINTLAGNAFFDVKRDESSPFVIRAQGIEIEVLGTSFYVDARAEEDEIQVIVKSGSVAVIAGEEKRVLEADEKAVYRKTSQTLIEQPNDDPNYESLQTNILSFNNTTLPEAVFALERHFNQDLSIQVTDPANCRITATFDNKSLETIIAVIEQTLGIEASQRGEGYVLSGEKCE